MRQGKVDRNTKETKIKVSLTIDGKGLTHIETGVGFLDHMLTLWAVHGLFDLEIKAEGDIHVDYHHTVEDVGICLGMAISRAMQDLKGINRYGLQVVPMEEALCEVAIDFCNRPYLVFNCSFPTEKIGAFDTELVEEFLRAVVVNSGITLHVNVRYGKNSHHMAEAIFKAFGRAMDQATAINQKIEGVPSSKGLL
ncbi:MAG: imidazoleglycerol-phosphate dehydratase HisB [Thermodesulfobacteria bacterium]|nr:imidazoleglycerol-phosphate dehydratase HisB [Thermodesulfobacteriota bacterium]